jgi:GH25 family lysozyme M1 (1,4-beta-N-acetylmuramidase)
MGIKYTDFSIRGVDASEFNGKIDWSNVASNSKFAVIRVGYGNNIDPFFVKNIESAQKTKLDLMVYWYSDYYSNWYNTLHSAYGLTDEKWGRTQADNCYRAIKPYGVKMVWLDIENITYKGFPLLTEAKAKYHAMAINKAFLERMNELGVKVGIYASLGWLSWFDNWFRSFPLWVAWYPFRTASVDKDDVIYMCRKNGWEVDPLIWQYASDGDVDDNGTPDGKTYFKTELKECDLNGWISTEAEYKNIFTSSEIIPDDETVTQPVENTRIIPVKTSTRIFTLRKSPKIENSTFIKLLPPGKKLDCLERYTDSKGNTWQRVGLDQWVAEVNNGITYLK